MQSKICNIITLVTWSFRNHSNMLNWCQRNISYYYQWKQLCFLGFLWKLWQICFQNSLMLKSWKEQHFFEMGIFCNIIFTVTFNKYNTFLLNNSINSIKKLTFYVFCISTYIWAFFFLWSYRNDQYLINTRGVAYTATA